MAEEKNSIFRKKSEEYINSPEKMDQYLHVTTPGVWAVLLGIIVFLIGTCAWGMAGKLETRARFAIQVKSGVVTAYVPEDAIEAVVTRRKAYIEDKEITLTPQNLDPVSILESTDLYIRLAGNLKVGDMVYVVPGTAELEDGIYAATIVTEEISPFSLLLN